MIELSLKEIIGTLKANVTSQVDLNEEILIHSICTDTRELASRTKEQNKGTLFFALKGPHFDAHQFIQDAQELGVTALLVEKESYNNDLEITVPQILVDDTRLALANLSKLIRYKSEAKFVGITGSCGKTTVKEMTASILKNEGETFSTIGNFNNSIGVPLSLFQISKSTDFAVIEMGASQIGEIAFTSRLVRPNVSLVNNVSGAHLEGFGDLHGVAQAKSEIYLDMADKGIKVINLDDHFANYFLKQCSGNKITFSQDAKKLINADVKAINIVLDETQCASFELIYLNDSVQVSLPLPGKHNVQNALAAASCCIALNVSLTTISKGLSEVKSVSGRLNIINLKSGCKLIDDTYNASLESIKAAINLLEESSLASILVLGDMAELGDYARQAHEEVGQYARDKNIDYLFTTGEFTKLSQQAFNQSDSNSLSKRGIHFGSQQDLIEKIIAMTDDVNTILVKGSRSAHMENVVKAIKNNDDLKNNKDPIRKIITKKSDMEMTQEEFI